MSRSPESFRTISEVAEWLETPAHVLRFWESKFTQVKPVKRAGGRRYYRPTDMQLLGGIKKLLHEDGMTIKGVQKLLREQGVKHVAGLSRPLDDLTAELAHEVELTQGAEEADAIEPRGEVVAFSRGAAEETKADADSAIEAGTDQEEAAPKDAYPKDDAPLSDSVDAVSEYSDVEANTPDATVAPSENTDTLETPQAETAPDSSEAPDAVSDPEPVAEPDPAPIAPPEATPAETAADEDEAEAFEDPAPQEDRLEDLGPLFAGLSQPAAPQPEAPSFLRSAAPEPASALDEDDLTGPSALDAGEDALEADPIEAAAEAPGYEIQDHLETENDGDAEGNRESAQDAATPVEAAEQDATDGAEATVDESLPPLPEDVPAPLPDTAPDTVPDRTALDAALSATDPEDDTPAPSGLLTRLAQRTAPLEAEQIVALTALQARLDSLRGMGRRP